MPNTVKVAPRIDGAKIFYDAEFSGGWETRILPNKDDWFVRANKGTTTHVVEYDRSVQGVPNAVAAIPFVSNILPIAWLHHATVEVDEIDQDFYESVEGVRRGFIGMYPDLKFAGKLVAKKIVPSQSAKTDKHLVLFSGGVDANYSALSYLAKPKTLVTLWGADIYFSKEDEWEKVKKANQSAADAYESDFSWIKSSFRSCINNKYLSDKFVKPHGADSWWHGAQHGLALLGHLAPLAYLQKSRINVISSTYSIYDDPAKKCGSWPTIDPFVRFCGTTTRHHDFFATRQDKVQFICEEATATQTPVALRVCWKSAGADNCVVSCEKCARTIFAVIAEKYDPCDFGFAFTAEAKIQITENLDQDKIRPTNFWKDLSARLMADPDTQHLPHVRAFAAAYERAATRNPALRL